MAKKSFQLLAPALGDYTLVVSEAGFDTVKTVVKLAQQATTAAPMLHIVLPISTMATTIQVNGSNGEPDRVRVQCGHLGLERRRSQSSAYF